MSAHFPLNEGKGAIVTEVISGVKGELKNGEPSSYWASSAKGMALKFDGVDDGVIVPNSPGFDFTDESFSISFWMRWPKGVEPNHERIFTKGDYSSSKENETGKRWELYMPSDEGLSFVVDDNIVKSQIQVAYTAYTTGEWVHVVAVRDRKAKKLYLYANGELQETIIPTEYPDLDGIDRTGDISNPKTLNIGVSGYLDNSFEGELSDIRIYRTALNPSDIADIAKLKGSADPDD